MKFQKKIFLHYNIALRSEFSQEFLNYGEDHPNLQNHEWMLDLDPPEKKNVVVKNISKTGSKHWWKRMAAKLLRYQNTIEI